MALLVRQVSGLANGVRYSPGMRLQGPILSFVAYMLAVGCSGRFEDAPASPEGSLDGSRDVTDTVPRADGSLESSNEVATGTEEANVGTDSGGASDGSPDGEEESPGVMEAGPSPIPTDGLLLWLRADVGVTTATVSGQDAIVTGWADQSANHL